MHWDKDMSSKVRTPRELVSINSRLHTSPEPPTRALMHQEFVEAHDMYTEKAECYKEGFLRHDFGHVRPATGRLTTTRSLEIDAWRDEVLCKACLPKSAGNDDGKGLTYFYYKYTAPPPTEGSTQNNSRTITAMPENNPHMFSRVLKRRPVSHDSKVKIPLDRQLANLPSHLAEISLHYADARRDLTGKDRKAKHLRDSTEYVLNDSGVEDEEVEHLDLKSITDKTESAEQETKLSARTESNELLHCITIDDMRKQHRHPSRRVLSADERRHEKATPPFRNPEHGVRPISRSRSLTETTTTESTYGSSMESEPEPKNRAVTKAFSNLLGSKDVVNNYSKRGLFKYEKFAKKKVQSKDNSKLFKHMNQALHNYVNSAIVQRHKEQALVYHSAKSRSTSAKSERNSTQHSSLRTENLLTEHVERRLKESSQRKGFPFLQELIEETDSVIESTL